MIDLTQRALPDTVMVDGRAFLIKTDYRIWIRFMQEAAKGKPFDCSYVFVADFPPYIPITALLEFAQPPKELPRQTEHNDAIVLDYKIDGDLIYAAFWEQYGIDLIETDLHWHKFIALLNGINETTALAKVMGYRSYKKGQKTKDPYQQMKRAWEIIPPRSEEEAEAIAEFESMFE